MSNSSDQENSQFSISAGPRYQDLSDSDSARSRLSEEYMSAKSTESPQENYQYGTSPNSDFSPQYLRVIPPQYPELYTSYYSAQYHASSSRSPDQQPSQSSEYHPQVSLRTSDQGDTSDGFGDSPFISAREASERRNYWNDRAKRGGYSAATHIADPLAHYSWLEHLENSVVQNSEYHQCHGYLQCVDDTLLTEIDSAQNWGTNMLASLGGMLPQHFPSSSSRVNPEELRASQIFLKGLWKSYWVLCKTLRSFENLRTESFCKDFYSMLVYYPKTHKARLVQIPQLSLDALKTGIENAIMRVFNEDPEELDSVLSSSVATQCNDILRNMNLLLSTRSLPIMTICRATVLLLDLALVSYVGSHCSPFLPYVQPAKELISINNREEPLFSCSRMRLACLSEYLDNSEVWVFQMGIEYSQFTKGDEGAAGIPIVTRMEEFADVWGPVWPERTKSGEIRQFNLPRGFIRALPGRYADNTIPCHWSSLPPVNDRDGEYPPLTPNALLTIGGALKKNKECHYTLEKYGDQYGGAMEQLGTTGSYWDTDGRAVGCTAGLYFNIMGSVIQKKLPGITLKEHILNSFSKSPVDADIEVLDQFIGVEISHCTGNARRVKMRDIFRLASVRERLRNNFGNWESKTWGAAFSAALQNPGADTLYDLWKDKSMRKDIAELVCYLLKLLDKTGLHDKYLDAAYFGPRDARKQQRHFRGNEWAELLRDSQFVATFAVVGDSCLKYSTRHNVGGLCQPTYTETMYETRLSFNGNLLFRCDYIKLQPRGPVFRVVESRSNRVVVLVPTDVKDFQKVFRNESAVEVMRRIGNRRSKRELIALIKASTKSYDGMLSPGKVINVVTQHMPADQPTYTPTTQPTIADQPTTWATSVPPREPVISPQAPRQAPRNQRVQGKKKSKQRSTKPPPEDSSYCCIIQ